MEVILLSCSCGALTSESLSTSKAYLLFVLYTRLLFFAIFLPEDIKL